MTSADPKRTARNTTKRDNANRLFARAISRWENEGGAPRSSAQETRETAALRRASPASCMSTKNAARK